MCNSDELDKCTAYRGKVVNDNENFCRIYANDGANVYSALTSVSTIASGTYMITVIFNPNNSTVSFICHRVGDVVIHIVVKFKFSRRSNIHTEHYCNVC